MAMRWLVLACLVSLTIAQTTMETTTMPPTTMEATTMEATTMEATTMAPTTMEATTMAPTTMEATTMAPTTMEATTEMSTESPVMVAQQNLTVGERYNRSQAEDIRAEHFFCPAQGKLVVEDVIGTDSGRTVNVWSLFLQYPVLAYLDSVKKQALVGQIVALINLGGLTPQITTDNICIGRVYHYDVSLYTESVLINFYFRDSTDPTGPARQIPIPSINAAFTAGVSTTPNNIIRQFQDRNAIIISNNTYGMIDQNVHPGAFRRDGSRFTVEDDPVLNAIILGYWPRQYSLDDFITDRAINESITMRFAENPNPVFYGLTGGDIVFIVIATLLCSLLAFLMVFGFCIQPFFM